MQIKRDLEKNPEIVSFSDQHYIRRCTEKIPEVVRWFFLFHILDGSQDITRMPTYPTLPPQGQKFEYLLNTGNMISKGYMDLSQVTGFTVVAEKLNYHRWALESASDAWSYDDTYSASTVMDFTLGKQTFQ